MEKNIKNQKGITLVALVITIIVMLILVAVSVTVAINGGLFTKAKEAGNSWEDKSEEEAAGNIINVDNQIANIDSAINTLKDRPKKQTPDSEEPGTQPPATTVTFKIGTIEFTTAGERSWKDWVDNSGWADNMPSLNFVYDEYYNIVYQDVGGSGNVGAVIFWPTADGQADTNRPVTPGENIENGVEYKLSR